MAIARFIGVDLAWLQRSDGREDNETGVVALDGAGSIVDAGCVVVWAKPSIG